MGENLIAISIDKLGERSIMGQITSNIKKEGVVGTIFMSTTRVKGDRYIMEVTEAEESKPKVELDGNIISVTVDGSSSNPSSFYCHFESEEKLDIVRDLLAVLQEEFNYRNKDRSYKEMSGFARKAAAFI